jgi:hypothetical protein
MDNAVLIRSMNQHAKTQQFENIRSLFRPTTKDSDGTTLFRFSVCGIVGAHTYFAAPLRGGMVGCVCSFYGSIEV